MTATSPVSRKMNKGTVSVSVSAVVTTGKIETVVNLLCPDGKRRTFYTQSVHESGNRTGFVSAGGKSVSGTATLIVTGKGKKQTKDWMFKPTAGGKNIGLVRPAHIGLGTPVNIKDTGVSGSVIAVDWDYLTPSYTIQPVNRRRKATVESAENLIVL